MGAAQQRVASNNTASAAGAARRGFAAGPPEAICKGAKGRRAGSTQAARLLSDTPATCCALMGVHGSGTDGERSGPSSQEPAASSSADLSGDNTPTAPLQRYAARLSASMDATRFKDDASDATDGGSFSVRCQGVENCWDIAGVNGETRCQELKALLAAASGIAQDSQRLIFQGAPCKAGGRAWVRLARLTPCASDAAWPAGRRW